MSTDRSGTGSPPPFARYDPPSSSSRTSTPSGRPRGRWTELQENLLSESYSPTWPTSAIGGRTTASELPTWARLTGGSDGSASPPSHLLPTPSASETTPADDFVDEIREHLDPDDPHHRLWLPGRKWMSQRTLSRTVPALLPTPTAADGDRTSEQGPRHYLAGDDNPTLLGAARRSEVEWGVYEAAVRRWEAVFGEPAPAPTDEKGRLAPEFVTWMLGYPEGWFDVEGVSRTRKLRALGNSVQVQVAEAVGGWLAALLESGLLLADE